MGGHGESKPNIHAGGILHRSVQKILYLSEGDDLVKFLRNLVTSHAQYRTVEKDIYATGELGMKAGPHFQKAADATTEHDPAFGRRSAAEDLEKRTLAGPIAPDDTDDLAVFDFEIQVLECPELLDPIALKACWPRSMCLVLRAISRSSRPMTSRNAVYRL
jgi:hypothetical protein